MEVMAVCGSWILCVGALLATPVYTELSILGCEDGSVDVVEGTDQLFTCGEYQTYGPQWTVYDDEGQALYSGSCRWRSCSPRSNLFRLQEVDHEKSYTLYRSTLTIKNITRARQVVCSDSPTRASCDLRIINNRVRESIIGGSVAAGTLAVVGVYIFVCIKLRNIIKGENYNQRNRTHYLQTYGCCYDLQLGCASNISYIKPMEVIAVCGSWILCVGALLGLPVCTALYIHDCPSGVRDVTEDTEVSFTCRQYTHQVEWSSFDGSDYWTIKDIGRCSGNGCTSLNGSIFFLQVKAISEKKYESTLYIRNLTRHQDFYLHCNEGKVAATCRLRVIAPAILKDCDVYIRDWQVHATCVVEHMYASDGMYWCTWRVNNVWLTSNFQDPLTEYSFNTRIYRKGACYANHIMPYSPGNYTYSIKIDPGVWSTVKTLEIVPPGNPVYTCSEVVQEGSNVSCKCTSSNPGTPPAEFSWNGRNNDALYVKNVQREENGNTHTCSMTWGPYGYIRRQAFLNLTVVAHEEDSVTVNNTATYQISTETSLSDRRVQESIIGGSVAVGTLALVGVVIFACIKRRNSKQAYFS
ncbi:uncharacterized protein LOC112567848 [Pomacea canaliculata]|uniref:uncharacterized protein LOC112567848 n=1 Tax=Pomacea canaliculata TaxID=400727 RepID=UPI000D73CE43|nr:uncharacterized protein LOC112567848 [Pomacea canaliculata]